MSRTNSNQPILCRSGLSKVEIYKGKLLISMLPGTLHDLLDKLVELSFSHAFVFTSYDGSQHMRVVLEALLL